MAFPAHWDAAKLDAVQGDVCKVAKTIAKHQPVSMLVESAHKDTAATLCGSTVDLVEVDIDDLWARDTAPVFVLDGGKLGAVDFNFNGWGGKQEHSYDAKVAAFVAGEAGAELITTWLTLEGGGLEVDGEGTAIVTESCVLNSNRNKDATKEDVEKELDKLLGIKKVIWLPGVKGMDITDGHTDFYAEPYRPPAQRPRLPPTNIRQRPQVCCGVRRLLCGKWVGCCAELRKPCLGPSRPDAARGALPRPCGGERRRGRDLCGGGDGALLHYAAACSVVPRGGCGGCKEGGGAEDGRGQGGS